MQNLQNKCLLGKCCILVNIISMQQYKTIIKLHVKCWDAMHSNIDSVTSGQVRIKCHLCAKHMKKITYLFAISITKIYISPASKLAYIASQDTFSWVPNCLLPPPPQMQNKVLLKINWYSLCENSWFPCNPLYDSKEWESAYKINCI